MTTTQLHTYDGHMTTHSPSILTGHEGAGRLGESVGHQSLLDEALEGAVLEPGGEVLVALHKLLKLLLLLGTLVRELQALLGDVLELLALKLWQALGKEGGRGGP